MGNELDTSDPTGSEPPPFDPDPDLITFLERGRKPTREEMLGWIERSSGRVHERSIEHDNRTT